MYGLPQAGCLANKLLANRLDLKGYYQCQFMPDLWRHKWRQITFSLVVDDFGIKTVGLSHTKHLKQTLEKYYEVMVDWKGKLFCGIKLDWDYRKTNLLIFQCPTASPKLTCFQHSPPSKLQHAPYKAPTINYGNTVQLATEQDNSPKLP